MVTNRLATLDMAARRPTLRARGRAEAMRFEATLTDLRAPAALPRPRSREEEAIGTWIPASSRPALIRSASAEVDAT
eukprot:10760879-Alexandrium_andersonii.AAC.1